jgi:hypothetical protein
MREAGLDESLCVFWNAVPWALERRRDPTDDEFIRGGEYLKQFLLLVPRRLAVVALSRGAQRACRLAGVDAIGVPSPSPLAVSPPGPQAGENGRRWIEVRDGLHLAAEKTARNRTARDWR